MFKKIVLAAIALIMLVGSATASKFEINIYGSLMQFKYWSQAADVLLQDHAGCGAVDQGTLDKHYIAKCNTATDEFIIRVSEASSKEGIYSVQGSFAGTGTNICNNSSDTTYPVYSDSYREMALDVSSNDEVTLGCVDVNVGASDVAAETFHQTTYGVDNWFAGIDDTGTGETKGRYWWVYDEYDNIVGSPNGIEDDKKEAKAIFIDRNTYDTYRPFVVPYSFFVNANVPVTNLSNSQIRNILSGRVNNWNRVISDLNGNGTVDETAEFPIGDNLPIQLCSHHAGSGALATLHANVIRGDVAVLNFQSIVGDGNLYGNPTVNYLNTNLDNLMHCIGSNSGAIGYAESGVVNNTESDTFGQHGLPYTKDDGFGMIRRLAFEGMYPDRQNIIDGGYGFWTAPCLYADQGSMNSGTISLLQALNTFASSHRGLIDAGKDDWWIASDEMLFRKADDFSLQIPK